MTFMKKYSKIGKLSSVLKGVTLRYQFDGKDDNGEPIYDLEKRLPAISIYGTVKIHGTNAGITQYPDGKLQFQSRERILDIGKDNEGFAFWASKNKDVITNLFDKIRTQENIDKNASVVLFGEWAGMGVQGGVAISQLQKALYLFDICIVKKELTELESNHYLPMYKTPAYADTENRIYNLWDATMFPAYRCEVDLERPGLAQNKLIAMTDAVEAECPVAKYLGVSGIGEGIVWRDERREFLCKIKGDKHAGKTKVKKTNIVDVEKMNSIKDFVEYAVNIERLEQAYKKMKELGHDYTKKTTGHFVRWLLQDVLEEESDVLLESNLQPREVSSLVSKKAANWFLSKI